LKFINSEKVRLGIDASRCRSGGAYAHLIGILELYESSGLDLEVHVWSHAELAGKLSHLKWLNLYSPGLLNKNIVFQLLWQLVFLKRALIKKKVDLLFTVDASTLCNFQPQVVLSQDLLSYEPGIMEKFSGLEWIRLKTILVLQNLAFRRARGVIFLSEYSSNLIQKSSGPISNYTIIPHGIGLDFKGLTRFDKPNDSSGLINCIYISNTSFYKNQWHVVKAIEILRNKGFNLTLTLIGGGSGNSQKALEKQINESDPFNHYIFQKEFVDQNIIKHSLVNTDIFIFASACETFGITLLEAMAVGLPIACSNRSGLPELLKDGGVYFNPESPLEISSAVEKLIVNENLRVQVSKRAKKIADLYSWEKCSKETFNFLFKNL
jgi:glycosyltransferase involved in cell wall biosynthesis